jgi:hypothetical protein
VAVRKERAQAGIQFVVRNIADLAFNARLLNNCQDVSSHDAGYAAASDCRSDQRIAVYEKHVAHGTADKAVLCIQKQAFEYSFILPFVSRHHLLESIQGLDACELRLNRKARVANADLYAAPIHDLRQSRRLGQPDK